MEAYYLYFMDRFSGHIDHRREFVADSDADAIAIAEKWFEGGPMELWLGGRKIRRWEEQPLPAGETGEGSASSRRTGAAPSCPFPAPE